MYGVVKAKFFKSQRFNSGARCSLVFSILFHVATKFPTSQSILGTPGSRLTRISTTVKGYLKLRANAPRSIKTFSMFEQNVPKQRQGFSGHIRNSQLNNMTTCTHENCLVVGSCQSPNHFDDFAMFSGNLVWGRVHKGLAVLITIPGGNRVSQFNVFSARSTNLIFIMRRETPIS